MVNSGFQVRILGPLFRTRNFRIRIVQGPETVRDLLTPQVRLTFTGHRVVFKSGPLVH